MSENTAPEIRALGPERDAPAILRLHYCRLDDDDSSALTLMIELASFNAGVRATPPFEVLCKKVRVSVDIEVGKFAAVSHLEQVSQDLPRVNNVEEIRRLNISPGLSIGFEGLLARLGEYERTQTRSPGRKSTPRILRVSASATPPLNRVQWTILLNGLDRVEKDLGLERTIDAAQFFVGVTSDEPLACVAEFNGHPRRTFFVRLYIDPTHMDYAFNVKNVVVRMLAELSLRKLFRTYADKPLIMGRIMNNEYDDDN